MCSIKKKNAILFPSFLTKSQSLEKKLPCIDYQVNYCCFKNSNLYMANLLNFLHLWTHSQAPRRAQNSPKILNHGRKLQASAGRAPTQQRINMKELEDQSNHTR